MSVTPGRRRRRRAFTLVELIVVITVLAILSLILIPVVAKVRTSAQSTHCTSNLQQIGRAFTLYAQEHRDCLPAPADPMTGRLWFEALHAYVGKAWDTDPARPFADQLAPIFTCPTLALSEHPTSRQDIGYAMSAVMGTSAEPESFRPVSLATLQHPSRMVMVIEASGTTWPIFPEGGSLEDFRDPYISSTSLEGCARHGGAANYLFADGHVGHFTPQNAAEYLKKQ